MKVGFWDKEMSPEEGWDYRNAMIEYSKECVVSRRSGLGNRMYGTRVHDKSP